MLPLANNRLIDWLKEPKFSRMSLTTLIKAPLHNEYDIDERKISMPLLHLK